MNKTRANENVLQQLKDYFSQSRSFNEIPLALAGTEFQKSVWHELTKIPPGKIQTYGDIAQRLNSSPRAVGNACRKNPVAIIIPCHRVVSAHGLGGYAGQTQGKQLDIKRWLLRHEGVTV
jgi:methylated-DNA-[protein]-cysteine S-methyltransferase